jgi:hypothetical protein
MESVDFSDLCEDDLSSGLKELVALIGLEKTVLLVQSFPGQRIYIPGSIAPNHGIAIALGIEAASALSAYFGRCWLQVPNGVRLLNAIRRRKIVEELKAGYSRVDIVKKWGVSIRTVNALASGLKDSSFA